MNKKVYLPFLMLTLASTLVAASRCDDSILSITNLGSDRFRYSIELSAGTIGQKGTAGLTKVDEKYSTNTTMYRLFSGEGTHGNISGKVLFQDTLADPYFNMTIPFTFTSKALGCHIDPKPGAYKGRSLFTIDAHKTRNHILDLKLVPTPEYG